MLKSAVALAAVIAALAPASAFASPPAPGVFLSTTCAHPGESVTATGIAAGPQGATFWWQLSASYAGFTVARSSPNGPNLGNYSPQVTTQFTVPWYAPWGVYSITMTMGSHTGAGDYFSGSTPLYVFPWC
jgi:hypothetical protein